MDKKDKLGLELKSLMEEEAKEISLSQDTINGILHNRKKGLIYQIKDFLNKEIEIPLAPVIVGLTAFLILTSVPKNIFKYESKEIIEIGSNQIIISSKEVGTK